MNEDNILLIFVKAPQTGQVKTRLQPNLSVHQSLSLHKAMAEDLVTRFRDTDFCHVKVFFWPTDVRSDMQKWLGDHLEYLPQEGSSLGERMHSAFARELGRKCKKVVIIGSDMPDLGETSVQKAFASLESCDVVLGPCRDGGYYLVGLKEPHPELFQDVSWSTGYVLEQTLQNARSSRLTVCLLGVRSDVDTYSDAQELWQQVVAARQRGEDPGLPSTYRVLQKLFGR
jgi:rSAM/selenodomain-associated transferase 1